jgi:hypothetical protein
LYFKINHGLFQFFFDSFFVMDEPPLIYVLSSFTYWILAAALFYKKAAKYKYGLALFIFVLFQPFFTYMGDCYDFTNEFNTWCYYDRAWATSGVATSVAFIYNNKFAPWGRSYYYGGMGIGLACWVCGLYLYRTKGTYRHYWIWAHTLWHIVPIVGGIGAILSILPMPPSA